MPKHILSAEERQENTSRAISAQFAVTAYQAKTKSEDEDALSDMLCDLHHLYGPTVFARELARGRYHYRAEMNGE